MNGPVRRSLPARWKLLVCAGACFVFIATFINALQPPNYSFDFSNISEPRNLNHLVAIKKRIDALHAWTPTMSKQGTSIALAGLMLDSANKDALRFRELLLNGDDERGVTVNSAILLLDRRVDEGRFGSLRRKSREALQKQLQIELDAAADSERELVFNQLLFDSATQALLRGLGVPPYPKTNGNGRFLRGALVSLQAIQEQWLTRFGQEVESSVEPMLAWYKQLDSTHDFVLGENKSNSANKIVLVKQVADSGIRYAQYESTVDLALWVSQPFAADESFGCRFDTGVRLFDVPIVGEKTDATNRPTVAWPVSKSQLQIDKDQFLGLLRYYELPTAFGVRRLKPESRGDARAPIVDVQFEMYHREVGNFQSTELLKFDSENPESIRRDIKSLCDRLKQQLDKSINEMTSLGGSEVAVVEPTDDDNVRHVSVHVADVGELRFSLSVRENGALQWSGQPSVAQRDALRQLISRKIPEFRNVDALLRVHSLQIIQEPTRIVGEIDVTGSLIDMDADLRGIECHILPEGNVFVELSAGHRDYLKSLENKSVDATAGDSSYTAVDVSDYLDNDYDALEDELTLVSLENSHFGQLLTLELTIADWPSLQLGPVRLNADISLQDQLDQLLAAKNVISVANDQWGGSTLHPRYGSATSELESWSPHNATATIACNLSFDSVDFQLPWKEDVAYQGGQWKKLTSEELCLQLEGKLKQLELQVKQTIFQLTGAEFDLHLERDAFGPGQWLRLCPPGVSVAVNARIPYTPLRVGVGDMLIEPEQIHWPKSIPITLETTIYMPHFCLSDPSLTVNWDRRGIALGAKITPPMIPLPGADEPPLVSYEEGDSAEVLSQFGISEEMLPTRLRIDNPWLHLLYMRGEFGGQLRDPSLQAEGGIVLLDYIDLARMVAEGRLKELEFEGRLEARPIPELPSFPALNGDLLLSASKGMRMQIRTSIGAYKLGGWLRADAQQSPVKLSLDGLIQLPVVGKVAVEGHSNLKFEEYDVTAQGVVPFLKFQLHYAFQANQLTTRFDYWWKTLNGKIVRYAIEVPTGNSIDEVILKADLKRLIDESNAKDSPIHPPNPSEQMHVAKAPPTPQVQAQGRVAGTGKSFPEAPPQASTSGARRGVYGDAKMEVKAKRIEFSSHSGAFRRFHLERSSVKISAPQEAYLAVYADGEEPRFVTIADVVGKRIRIFYVQAPDILQRDEDLTPELKPVADKFFKAVQTNSPQDLYLAGSAICSYSRLKALDLQPAAPEFISAGIVIDVPKTAEGFAGIFCWPKDQQTYRVDFLAPSIDEGEIHQLCTKLATVSAPSRHGMIVAREQTGANGRVAWAGWGDDTHMQLNSDLLRDDDETLEITLVDQPANPLPMVRAYAKLLWSDSVPKHRTAWIGPEGLCLLAENGLYLLPTSQVMIEGGSGQLTFLSRKDFVDWTDDTVRFLPPVWRDPAYRREMSLKDLTQTLLSDWQKTKKQSEQLWEVNPLGLAVRLAKQKTLRNSQPPDKNNDK